MAQTQKLLNRLERVKATGTDRWLARCPAHEDKTPSLSIRETSDGKTLIHCFSGCSTDAVLDAVSLEISDLFPERDDYHCPPAKRPFNALDALKALSLETTVVLLAARDMLEAGDLVLGQEGFDRLALACERVQSALNLVNGSGRHG